MYSISEAMCNLQVGVEYMGPKIHLRVRRDSFFVGQDAGGFLCCLAKVGIVGYYGEVEVFW